jgi:hypothetical protein
MMVSNAFKNRVCIRSGLTVAEFFVQTYPPGECGDSKVERYFVPLQYCRYRILIMELQ